MEKQMTQEHLLKGEKERLDNELNIADSLIDEAHNPLKQTIAANPRKMEGICAAQALLETGQAKLTEIHAGLKNVD